MINDPFKMMPQQPTHVRSRAKMNFSVLIILAACGKIDVRLKARVANKQVELTAAGKSRLARMGVRIRD